MKKNKLQNKQVDKNREFFSYPFNYNLLNQDLKISVKEIIKFKKRKEIKLYILSGSTLHNIETQIKLFCSNFGINIVSKIGNYNNYFQEALFSNKISNFNPDWVYVHTNFKNLIQLEDSISSKNRINNSINENINILKKVIESNQLKNKKIIINNFEKTSLVSYSHIEILKQYSSNDLIGEINIKLKKLAANYENVFINDIEFLSSLVGINNWVDSNFWAAFKIAFSQKAIPYLSSSIASIIAASEGRNKKLLICDLDNTLWGGVIGDLGFKDIEIGPDTPNGEIFLEIQSYIFRLIKMGIIVAIVSKNNEKDAKKGLENKYSKLKINDFAIFCANWKPKSENIKEIIKTLNVTEESVVFIDDNPAELEEVRKNLPLITTIGYTHSPRELITTIERIGYFKKINITSEDIKRIKFYKQNSERTNNQKDYKNYNDFLKGLRMKANIVTIKKETITRASQLINKTNQFNLTYQKIDEVKLDKIAKNKKNIILESNLDDKFGKNGIVSILYGTIIKKIFFIENWVMSCRVFKRELELAIMDELTKICIAAKINIIKATLHKNDKNEYIHDLFDKLDFKLKTKSRKKEVYEKKIDNKIKKLNFNISINEK